MNYPRACQAAKALSTPISLAKVLSTPIPPAKVPSTPIPPAGLLQEQLSVLGTSGKSEHAYGLLYVPNKNPHCVLEVMELVLKTH